MAVRILHRPDNLPDFPLHFFPPPLLQPSYSSTLQNVPNTQCGLPVFALKQRDGGTVSPTPAMLGCIPHAALPCHKAHRHWQDTCMQQHDIKVYLRYYKEHSLALWSWLRGAWWVREAGEPPGTAPDAAASGAGCCPAQIPLSHRMGRVGRDLL